MSVLRKGPEALFGMIIVNETVSLSGRSHPEKCFWPTGGALNEIAALIGQSGAAKADETLKECGCGPERAA
jgi:hypothetical protein